jgi:transposase
MVAIGIDTHKATLAACAVDEVGRPLEQRTFRNDRTGHDALLAWAAAVVPGARIGIEGSSTYGAALARKLASKGIEVCEVPAHLTGPSRRQARGAGKTDPGDALAIARVVLREPDLPPVRRADRTRDLALLVDAREALVTEATRGRNRLHAHLVVLVPGYQERVERLVSEAALRRAGRLLRGIHCVEAELARRLIGELRRRTAEIASLTRRIEALVGDDPLLRMPGIGPLTAARLIGETGDVRRFRSADAFASLAGVAPIPASSGNVQRVRMAHGGNRQLNRALFTIALTQVWHHPPARAYVDRKRAEGKTWREAIRCLKRHLARRVFELLQESQAAAVVAA